MSAELFKHYSAHLLMDSFSNLVSFKHFDGVETSNIKTHPRVVTEDAF